MTKCPKATACKLLLIVLLLLFNNPVLIDEADQFDARDYTGQQAHDDQLLGILYQRDQQSEKRVSLVFLLYQKGRDSRIFQTQDRAIEDFTLKASYL